jgi:hypothetical protein
MVVEVVALGSMLAADVEHGDGCVCEVGIGRFATLDRDRCLSE